jgi:hypothetical protein
MWFLSLAFADGVFDSYNTFEELEQDDVLQGGNDKHTYVYKEGIATRLIMRSMQNDSTISKLKI